MRRRVAGCAAGAAGGGPAAAALVDPVHVTVTGLPSAGLVTVLTRALDKEGQPWGVGSGVPGQCRGDAEPGHGGTGLGQLPHRRCRRASPYFPFFTATELGQLGGSEQASALATEQFWTRMITFLHHREIHQPPAAGMPQER